MEELEKRRKGGGSEGEDLKQPDPEETLDALSKNERYFRKPEDSEDQDGVLKNVPHDLEEK